MEVQSVTSVSCALTHPGWNNDIPHHVIQPPRYSLPRHPDPSAPHIPGHSGERGNLPSYGPGAPVSGLAAAKERGYGLCLKEYMSYVKDTLSESPQPALPLACISNAGSPTARAKTGRRRRELHRAANASLDQRTAGLSPLSSISGTGICPTCLPGSPGLDLVLLGAGGGRNRPAEPRSLCPGGRPPKHVPSHLNQTRRPPSKQKQMGLQHALPIPGLKLWPRSICK